MIRPSLCVALALSILAPHTSRAQRDTVSAVGACTYGRCALRIAPRWNGLAAVRGERDDAVAHLSFFWPRETESALTRDTGDDSGTDSASAYISRALNVRRAAAAFTDAGVLFIVAAGARAIAHHEVQRGDAVLAGVGAGAFAVGVPLQFSADDLLGKAVWWYNRRFAP